MDPSQITGTFYSPFFKVNEEGSSGIFFYDGDCGFCQRSVSFLLKMDKKHLLYFAPLQGKTASMYLDDVTREDLNSSVFLNFRDCELYKNSNAVLKSMEFIDPPFYQKVFIQLGLLVPVFIRDFVYKIVASNRKHLNKGYCFVPNVEQKQKMLD